MNIKELKSIKTTVSTAMTTLASTEVRQDRLISLINIIDDDSTVNVLKGDISKLRHVYELQMSLNSDILHLLNNCSEHDLEDPDFEELFGEIVASLNFLTVRLTVLMYQLSEFERSMN